MTKEGRLARGKKNVEYVNITGKVGRFLNNSETLEYVATLQNSKESKKDATPTK